jgi:uncharacterized protein
VVGPDALPGFTLAGCDRLKLPAERRGDREVLPLPPVDAVYTLSTVGAVEFEWDDDNVEHLARHGIVPDEVEDLFEGPIVRRRGGTDAPDRFRVLGRTAEGRYLAIVYQAKARGVIRPFTGWDMRPHERERYGRQVKD